MCLIAWAVSCSCEWVRRCQSIGVAPLPQGSPLNTSMLLHDHGSVKALNLLPGTEKKTLRGRDRESFVQYKAQKYNDRRLYDQESREEMLAELREFSETFTIVAKPKTPKSDPKSPMQPSVSTAMHTPDEAVFGDQHAEMEHVELASQDAAMQRELTPLKIEPNEVDEELGEGDSGPGLNPHARPFNPGQYTSAESVPTVPSGSDGSGVDPRPPSTRAETPVEKEDEEFPPLQPPQLPQPQSMIPSTQPMVLIRQQPPPPPPRVVTPPPPPVQEMAPQMIIPMIRPSIRPNRGSSSPAGRRTPHQPMQDPQMMMTNPPMLIHSDSGPISGSGPPMHSNGQPPQMVPMMPPMSGPMPMMPQQIPYGYAEGRVPVFFPYHGPMPHVQPPQAPPGQNPPQDQMPQMVYPAYYPAAHMSQYPMTYPSHMIPPGLPQHYMSVATPMTPRPAQQRPRPNRRKSFLNYGPRRG